jgi:polysaccharide deacetylase family protein (PEP-CTERM system associated)
MNPTGRVSHHFTVDVEEYFQVVALAPFVDRTKWDSIPRRAGIGTRLILEMLAERKQLGTFFTLSWVAERDAALVREIADAGHEIASHGTDHRRVTELNQDQFRESVRTSRRILEDVTGKPVFGYRAPSFSIVRGREWALDILGEEGYRYDSSLFPVKRKGYGFVGGQRDPHRVDRAGVSLDEIPPSTIAIGSKVLPAGGGAYFRLLPYKLVHSALESAEERGVPGTFYIHPWELDPAQPRVKTPFLTRVRHYGGMSRTASRIKRLLSDFHFQPIAATLGLAA